MYGVALSYLQGRHFISIDLAQATLTPEECLRFFYYKGIWYVHTHSYEFSLILLTYPVVYFCSHIADKSYAQAIDSFITVMSLPTAGLSLIAVKSYKKARLLHLILHSKPLLLPTYTHPGVLSYSQDKCAGYDDVADRFTHYDVAGLQSVLATALEVFDADQNTGLVRQVLVRLRDAAVQRIADAFSTITFAELSSRLHMPSDQVVDYLLDMVARRQIIAEIDVQGSMVALSIPSSSAVSVHEANHLLNTSFDQLAELTKVLRERHAELLTSPTYVSRVTG
ncbi:hypothetical protein EON65_50410, partial [archaeon]